MGFNRKEHQSHQRRQNERKGEFSALLKATESAMPVVATAQLVVASSRTPDLAAMHLASIQMGEQAQFGPVERRLRRGIYRCTL
jgi:hypothetical protein